MGILSVCRTTHCNIITPLSAAEVRVGAEVGAGDGAGGGAVG